MVNPRPDNKGIALLTVMLVMTVLIIVGTLVLTMATSENRMVNDYGNVPRAFYASEAGADIAAMLWSKHVKETLEYDKYGAFIESSVERIVTDYITRLQYELNRGGGLLNELNFFYNTGDEINIEYLEFVPDNGSLNHSSGGSPDTLKIKIKGSYDDAEYIYGAKLWYYLNGTTGSYKGMAEPYVNLSGDTTPPVISATNPPENGTNVPVDQIITITFNEPVVAGAAFENISLFETESNAEADVEKVINNTEQTVLELRPLVNLAENTSYTVAVPTSSVTDFSGNKFIVKYGGVNRFNLYFATGEEKPVNGEEPVVVEPVISPDNWLGPDSNRNLKGNWDFSENNSIITHKQTPPFYAYYSDREYSNFTIQVAISVSKPGGNPSLGGDAGLLFFYDPLEDSGYFFGIKMKSRQFVLGHLDDISTLDIINDGYSHTLPGEFPQSFLFEEDTEYVLKVVSTSGTVTLFINDVKVHETAIDDTGYIGVFETVDPEYSVHFSF